MIDYQATNIINAALNLDLRSKSGLEEFTQIVQTALNEAAQQGVQADGALCEDCGKNPVMNGCSVCAECGL